MGQQNTSLRSLVRSVLILLGGQSLAQLIAFASSPILTRLYSPEDFGFLREILAWSGVFVGIASLRYDMAIPLPRGERVAGSLVAFCNRIVVVISLLTVVVTAGALFFGYANVGNVFWTSVVGLVVYLTGTFNTGRWWSVRHGRFSVIARAAVVGAVVSALGKCLGGLLTRGGESLVWGHVLGALAAWWWIQRSVACDDTLRAARQKGSSWSFGRVATIYREFPLFHAPMTLANNFGQQLPVFIIGTLFSQAMVGHWSLAVMIGKMPIVMVAMSVSQVFVKRSADRIRARQSVLKDYLTITALLCALALLYALGVWFLAEPLLPIVFGAKWIKAAHFIKLMLPWTVCIMIASPAVGMIAPLRLQKSMLVVQVSMVVVLLCGAKFIDFSASADTLVLFVSTVMGCTSIATMCFAVAKSLSFGRANETA